MQKQFQLESQGATIRGLIDKPDSDDRFPSIIMSHGLTNTMHSCPLMEAAVGSLVKNGFMTLRFDYYGSGSSDGQFKEKSIPMMWSNLKDAVEYLLSLDCIQRNRIGLWGRSIGGVISVTARLDIDIKATTLISVPFDLRQAFLETIQMSNDNQWIRIFHGNGYKKGDSVLHSSFLNDLYELDIAESFSKLKGVLVVHGSNDRLVPLWHAKRIFETAQKPKELIVIEGANHNYIDQEEKTVEVIVSWFMKHLKT